MLLDLFIPHSNDCPPAYNGVLLSILECAPWPRTAVTLQEKNVTVKGPFSSWHALVAVNFKGSAAIVIYMIARTLWTQLKWLIRLFKPVCHCHKVVFSITVVTHDSRTAYIKVDKALNSFCRADKVDWRAGLGSSAHVVCVHLCVCVATHTPG